MHRLALAAAALLFIACGDAEPAPIDSCEGIEEPAAGQPISTFTTLTIGTRCDFPEEIRCKYGAILEVCGEPSDLKEVECRCSAEKKTMECFNGQEVADERNAQCGS